MVAIVHYTNLYLPIVTSFKQYITYQLQPLMGFFSPYQVSIMHVYGGRTAKISEYGDYLKKAPCADVSTFI